MRYLLVASDKSNNKSIEIPSEILAKVSKNNSKGALKVKRNNQSISQVASEVLAKVSKKLSKKSVLKIKRNRKSKTQIVKKT